MRQRTEIVIAGVALALVVVIAAATGQRARVGENPDFRTSSYNPSRDGVKGTADALERLGVRVVRWRERPRRLLRSVGGKGTLFAVLNPINEPSTDEWQSVRDLANDSLGSDLLLAGNGASPLMRCFGFAIGSSVFDSAQAVVPGRRAARNDSWVHSHLLRASEVTEKEKDRPFEEDARRVCEPPDSVSRVDTILVTTEGRLVMATVHLANVARTITLVADEGILRNRTMRVSPSAPVVLEAVARGHSRVVFDEYHQGVRAGGSMANVLIDWSITNPAGWMGWQLLGVGLIALLFGAVRFGPVLPSIDRARRSSLEHVQALATALAAARGHAIAIDALVRGLRRRLTPMSPSLPSRRAPGETHTRGDWRPWLESLVRHAPNDRARASADAVLASINSPKPDTAVLTAANAVEDLWNDLRP